MSQAPEPDPLLTPRDQIFDDLRRLKRCDVLIIGGGIHGATFARLAAFHGLSTVLLERDDYAMATSSRSSKMAHGGLRYLESGDLRQVLEGVKARESLFRSAAHLVKPTPFLIPIRHGEFWKRLKFSLGLTVYDLSVPRERRHHWRSSAELVGKTSLPLENLSGAMEYSDGVMNDSRLVLETILAARQEGARCLNYTEVESCTSLGEMVVSFNDRLTKQAHSLRAGIVVNCAGPWVPRFGGGAVRLAYSRGSHLLFNREWIGPALLLPMAESGRYYFVWPHVGGTLVGTTEREVRSPESDPLPAQDEIQEILDRLERDLPGCGLDRSTLYYCFAGIRTLPLRDKPGSGDRLVWKVSRRHIWSFANGILSLWGGKYTTASWTTQEGLKRVFDLAGRSEAVISLADRKLPGSGLFEESVTEFRKVCDAQHIDPGAVDQVLLNYGSLVRNFDLTQAGLDCVPGVTLRAAVRYAVNVEQAQSIEDVLRRRLGLEYQPDHGIAALNMVREELQRAGRGQDLDRQECEYRERIGRIGELLRN